jgi:hypothetical protein
LRPHGRRRALRIAVGRKRRAGAGGRGGARVRLAAASAGNGPRPDQTGQVVAAVVTVSRVRHAMPLGGGRRVENGVPACVVSVEQLRARRRALEREAVSAAAAVIWHPERRRRRRELVVAESLPHGLAGGRAGGGSRVGRRRGGDEGLRARRRLLRLEVPLRSERAEEVRRERGGRARREEEVVVEAWPRGRGEGRGRDAGELLHHGAEVGGVGG